MAQSNSTGITMQNLKDALPFGTLLVAIVVSWGTVGTQLALLSQKTDTIIEKHDSTLSRITEMNNEQIAQGKDIAAIKQVISDAQARGLLSHAVSNSPSIHTREADPVYTPVNYDPKTLSMNEKNADESAKLEPTPVPTPEEKMGIRTIQPIIETILKPLL